MCGRYGLSVKGDELAELLELDEVPDIEPRYNIAPSQPVLVIRGSGLSMLKWGLVPFWATDPKIGFKLINARSETVHEKKAFRWAMRARRCLIPADGFYEWKKAKNDRLPYHFEQSDGRPFCMAGLWEKWQGADGSKLETCTILTTAANSLVAEIHDRMPVIVQPDHYRMWLDPSVQSPEELAPIYEPLAANAMRSWAVGRTVSNPMVDSPACREPAPPTRQQTLL